MKTATAFLLVSGMLMAVLLPSAKCADNLPLDRDIKPVRQLYNKQLEKNKRLIQENPFHLQAHCDLAQLYQFKNDYENAIRHYRFVLGRKPDHLSALYLLGRCYVERGWDTVEGITLLKKGIDLAEDQAAISFPLAEAYFYLGQAYYYDEQYDKALESYQSVNDINPHFPEINFTIGQVYYVRGWMPQAQQAFLKEIQRQENHAESHLYLGLVYQQKGQSEQGMAEMRLAVQWDPLQASAHRWLAYYYASDGKTAQAVYHYLKTIELHPEDTSLRTALARIYYDNKQYNSAIEQLEAVQEKYPRDSVSAALLAECYQAKHDPASARAVLRKVKQYSNGNVLLFILALFAPAGLSFWKSQRLLQNYKQLQDEEQKIKMYHAFRQWCGRVLGVGIFIQVSLFYFFHLDYLGLAYGLKHFPLLTILAVIFVLFTTIHLVFIRVDRIIRQTKAGIGDYLRTYYRMTFLVSVQWIMILAVLTYASKHLDQQSSVLFTLAFLAVVVYGYVLLFPYMFRILFPHSPCPPDIKKALQRTCQKIQLNPREILVIETSDIKLANAAATGIGKKQCYIYLTSYLLDVLSFPELEAIFLHECGHLKKNHIRWQAHMLFAYLVVMIWVLQKSAAYLGAYAIFLTIGLLSVYALLRSWLSQKQEQETDEFAVDHADDPGCLIKALEKLYLINYVPKQWKAPRHPALTKRIEYIQERIKIKEQRRGLA